VQYFPDNSTNRAIVCSDLTISQRLRTIPDVRAFINRLKQVAPRFGESAAFQTAVCFGFPIPPIEPPPLNVSLPVPVPTLVVGGSEDGATPFVWSQRIAQRIGGRLLTREGYAHVSYDKSTCVRETTDHFLTDLVLPPAGKVCATDDFPPESPLLPPLG
jgi:TAP-like protein